MNAKITIEPCPICGYPEAECEHWGHNHFWTCPEHDDRGWEAIAPECEECANDRND